MASAIDPSLSFSVNTADHVAAAGGLYEYGTVGSTVWVAPLKCAAQ